MNVLGVWDGHDSGAALVVDGRVVAAVNEERLSRRKLEVRFPTAAIAACLELGRLAPADVDVVAGCTTDVAKALARLLPSTKEDYYRLRRRQAVPGPLAALRKRAKYWLTEWGPNPVSRAVSRACLGRTLRGIGLGGARLRLYDHHGCHAMGAACASGFERALVVTLDGVGDGLSATVSLLDGHGLRRLAATPAADSPGIFFEHVTNLLNMRELEDEGKVMALAGYAAAPERNPLLPLVQARGLRFATAAPGHALHARLRRIQWAFPNEQFARMAQETLEQAVVAVVARAVGETGVGRVALAGGVASNIRISRLIRMLPEVEDVFVFPHMGDGGLALGAALAAAAEGNGRLRVDLGDLGLGPGWSDAALEARLRAAGQPFRRPPQIVAEVAARLVRGQVVLWFEGRMEYGPRALGHRSILARPDRPDLRDRLNLVLKRRVWYQPFCPSLLESDAQRLFADWKGRPDRFMAMAYEVRPEARAALSGVINVDGTCRPQIVADDAAGPWAALLHEMKRLTGTGAVLNTSFNIHGEPLVCTPEEALDVYARSGADALALGPFLVERGGTA